MEECRNSTKALFAAVIAEKKTKQMSEEQAKRITDLENTVRKMDQDIEHLKDVIEQMQQFLMSTLENLDEMEDIETPNVSDLFCTDEEISPIDPSTPESALPLRKRPRK